jgi:putative radical SAM enzyme (TIGR03279 family)
VAVNGCPPEDVLDLELAAADGDVAVRVAREGRHLDLTVRAGGPEGHGVELDHGIGVPPRVCRNDCRFCFVDQVPPGLRPGLSVKDDDYRLSFLQGTFITLTNLTRHDIERILALRLSPLYVSLHAWDERARVALMGRPARSSTRVLQELDAAGISTHVQVVVCPGWNDGDVLEETIARLSALANVADVGLVPVSLTDEGALRRVAPGDAEAVLAFVERAQRESRARLGRDFVHAADEFHLLCRRLPPPSDADLQYENGIGLSAHVLQEAAEVAVRSRQGGRLPEARLLGGVLARTVLEEVCARLRPAGVHCRPFEVPNRLFGPHVTVTGLLGGREVLAALAAEPLAPGEWLLAPRSFLPADLGRTLDDVAEADLAAACGGRLSLGDGLADAFARLTG